MDAVVVVESCFGNTSAAAEAVAEGLRGAGAEVRLFSAHEAPSRLTADLAVLAAPTHNAGLPKAASRAQAADQGAETRAPSGLREWIERAAGVEGRIVTMSTTTGGRFAGSAAKATVKALRRRRIAASQGENFRVTATPGPLADGELDRARAWGAALAG